MQHATDRPVDAVAPRAGAQALRGTEFVDLAVAGMGCPNCANRVRNAS